MRRLALPRPIGQGVRMRRTSRLPPCRPDGRAGTRPRSAPLLMAVVLATMGLAASGAVDPARARLSQQALASVVVAPAPGARAPLDLRFEDAASGRAGTLAEIVAGRPVLLLPVDYTCGNVCDPMLAMSAAALAATGLRADRDYAFVLVGIDPRDTAAAARRMIGAEAAVDAPPHALVGSTDAVDALTGALGYRALYDADTDSFAHPAAALLLTADGRVARVLSPLALNPRDLRLALVDAGEGRVGSLADRLILLCYGFDGVRGVYTPLIQRILALAAAGTIAAIALGLLVLRRREGRS